MGAVVNNIENGGGKTKGVRDVLQGGGAGSISLWVGDVGDDPLHRRGHWGVSTQDSYMDHWEVSPAVSVWKLVVPTFVDGNAGGGV